MSYEWQLAVGRGPPYLIGHSRLPGAMNENRHFDVSIKNGFLTPDLASTTSITQGQLCFNRQWLTLYGRMLPFGNSELLFL